MNSTRLFVLGALARYGPMYGHQIRRQAQLDRTELWTSIKQGSLYGALHRMAAEGAVRVARTEREGNFPARTVYEITPLGEQELVAIRDEAFRHTGLDVDPVDLAIHTASDLPTAEVRARMEARRAVLAATLASWQQLRVTAAPHLSTAESIVFAHSLMRLEAEIAWHDHALTRLSEGGPGEP